MSESWERFYADALLETDERNLAHRITVAESALSDSLAKLGHSQQDVRELKRMQEALRTLRYLRKELDLATESRNSASEHRRAG